MPFTIKELLTLTPNVNFAKSFDKEYFEDELYGGLTTTIKF